MVWVPSTKVHARFVLSKHVRQKFFHTDKTTESRKSYRSSGDYVPLQESLAYFMCPYVQKQEDMNCNVQVSQVIVVYRVG
jgi:hypothetical protein